jgi:uncharacterized RDD family membrane protein YckC
MLCPRCSAWTDDQAQSCAFCGSLLTRVAARAAAPAAPGWLPTLGYAAAPHVVLYAGFWRRLAATVVDGILIYVASFVLAMMVGVVYMVLFGEPGMDTQVALLVMCEVGGWLYFAGFESSALQATPGKMWLGIRVIDTQGQRITFGRATGRYFAKILSALPLYVGFMMAGFTERRQAAHDFIASCLVVREQ